MKNLQTKHIIKIINNVTVFYCPKKKIIIFRGPLGQRSLKIDVSIHVSQKNRQIEVTPLSFAKLSNIEKKKLKALQGTTISLIRQRLIETTATIHQKLNLIGVGYRAFPVENFEKSLLLFKLGYSHSVYFKIPTNINIFCLKLTKLFVYGNSYQNVTFAASQIRSNKFPEPYKGKGILYENEKIVLKEGKKV